MNRKIAAVVLTVTSALTLTACGSLFEKEYVSVEPYVPVEQMSSGEEESITVHSYADLQKTLQEMVYAGSIDGTITFDPDYKGNVADDLASVTWQLRTGDALFAYCVDNISYELTQIVTYYEANIHVTYGKVDVPVDKIVIKNYFTGIDTLISQTLEEGESRLGFLVNHSLYGEDDIKELVTEAYHNLPYVSPHTPEATVNVYSGTGSQKLYEVTIDYGVSAEELQQCRDAFAEYDPFASLDTISMTETEKAIAAYQVVGSTCIFDETAGDSAYAALFERRANSEGIALAYSELCRRLNVECQLVYGQYLWNDFTWNIITVDGACYHVDAAHAVTQPGDTSQQQEIETDPDAESEEGVLQENLTRTVNLQLSPFMQTDEQMWSLYRWDTVKYPACETVAEAIQIEDNTAAESETKKSAKMLPENSEINASE